MVEENELNAMLLGMHELRAKGVNIRADSARIYIDLENRAEIVEETIILFRKILNFHRASQNDGGDLPHDDLRPHLPGIDPNGNILHGGIDHKLDSESRFPDSCISSYYSYFALTEALNVFIEAFPACGETAINFHAVISRQICEMNESL